MKERPILFQGDMVRAILSGEKTQTRRIISTRHVPLPPWGFMPDETDAGWPEVVDECGDHHPAVCPYGQAKDRLWVRETFTLYDIPPTMQGAPQLTRGPMNPHGPLAGRWQLAAGYDGDPRPGGWPNELKRVPSIHMPRWASRLTLEVTGVRVERLHAISEEDAQAEGADRAYWKVGSYRDAFTLLWKTINGDESWAANPWVWVISFRRVEP